MTEWREKYAFEVVLWQNTRLVLGKDGKIYLYCGFEEPEEMIEIGQTSLNPNDLEDLIYPFSTKIA